MSTAAKISIDQYDIMIGAGAFDGAHHQRVELLAGEICQMNPIGPTHEYCVDLLNRWSLQNAPQDQVIVRVQNSIGLPGLESVPQPDIAWVVNRSYREQRPQAKDVLLLIEVADSSLAIDRGEKADLYAAAGIGDYWIVDVRGKCIEVFRAPSAGTYGSQQTFSSDKEVSPLVDGKIVLSLADLFS